MEPFDPDAAARPGSGLFGLSDGPGEALVRVIPVPFDATTSYRHGAAHGPRAVLAASHQVELFDPVAGTPYRAGICMEPIDPLVERWNAEARELAAPVIAAGGVPADRPDLARARDRVDAIGAELNAWLEERTGRALDAGKLPVVLGGDHSTPFGAIAAAAARHPGLGVLHFDAHADLREAFEGFAWSHASILFNVVERLEAVARVVQVGVRDLGEREHRRIAASEGRVQTLFDREWTEARLARADLRDLARGWIARLPGEVWITFDVDGLDPTLCPSTGTPVPGGLSWPEALLWLDELARSGKRVVGADLNEVSPGPGGDPEGTGWDAIVGARLLYQLVGAAVRSRGLG